MKNYLRNFLVMGGHTNIHSGSNPGRKAHMGEKITRPAKSADLRRARLLKDALQRGSPPALRHPQDPSLADRSTAPTNGADHLEVQRAYLDQLVEDAPEAISI